jgi:hypothetical protein
MSNARQPQGAKHGWIKPLSYKSWGWIFNSANSICVILYEALATGYVPGYNSILNSMALLGGILGKSSANTSGNSWTTCDSRMSPDLLRGTDKSIGGDLDVDDEGSEQRQF